MVLQLREIPLEDLAPAVLVGEPGLDAPQGLRAPRASRATSGIDAMAGAATGDTTPPARGIATGSVSDTCSRSEAIANGHSGAACASVSTTW